MNLPDWQLDPTTNGATCEHCGGSWVVLPTDPLPIRHRCSATGRVSQRGLGDPVAAFLKVIGITPRRFARLSAFLRWSNAPVDCGCERRRRQLNRLGKRLRRFGELVHVAGHAGRILLHFPNLRPAVGLARAVGYDGDMRELRDVFVELLSNNRGPGYGVKVIDAATDLSHVDVEIVFVAGRTYCCAEPGCHLPRDSKRLMKLAAIRSISIPERATIKWHFRIEAGARLECHKALGLPLESHAYQFDVVGPPP